jgi:hypothetical protein
MGTLRKKLYIMVLMLSNPGCTQLRSLATRYRSRASTKSVHEIGAVKIDYLDIGRCEAVDAPQHTPFARRI